MKAAEGEARKRTGPGRRWQGILKRQIDLWGSLRVVLIKREGIYGEGGINDDFVSRAERVRGQRVGKDGEQARE